MRDPEMHNYVRQVLQYIDEHNTDLEQALAMHGNNMTDGEVRDTAAETPTLHGLFVRALKRHDVQAPKRGDESPAW